MTPLIFLFLDSEKTFNTFKSLKRYINHKCPHYFLNSKGPKAFQTACNAPRILNILEALSSRMHGYMVSNAIIALQMIKSGIKLHSNKVEKPQLDEQRICRIIPASRPLESSPM